MTDLPRTEWEQLPWLGLLLTILLLTAGCAGSSPADTSTPTDAARSTQSAPAASAEANALPTGTARFRSSLAFVPRPSGETEARLGYYEYLPPSYGDGRPSPLLVLLNGLDENGDGTAATLNRLLATGIPELISSDAWPADRPFVVLAPQHPGPVDDEVADNELYGACFERPLPGDCALPIQTENGHPERNSLCHRPVDVHDFLAYALATYDVDPDRVYLTGLSCGGYAAYEYIAEYGASQIAAMVPIAGYGRLAWDRVGCALGDVPIWAFHGGADEEISPAGSIEPLANLDGCPSAKEHKLTIYPGVGHDSWTRTYDLSAGNDVYTWLLGFKRG